MSQAEEDPELRELVTEALEKTGVLAAVRAHLRAGVFLALEREHEQKRSHHTHLHQMLNTHDGRLALLLVHELLEFCRLRHTASVYSAETGQPNTYTYKGRESLLYDLKLTNMNENSHLPVLVQLISVLFKLSKTTPSTSHSSIKNNVANDNNVQNDKVELNSPDNYDTTFTSDSTNSTNDRSKAAIQLNLNGSEENDKSLSDHIDDDKFSSVSEQSLGNDAHIELHTDSEKSYSDHNTSSSKNLKESVNSEALSDNIDVQNGSIISSIKSLDLLSPKKTIDEMSASQHSNQNSEVNMRSEDVLNETIEDNSIGNSENKLDVLSHEPSQNSSKTDVSNESIIEEIIQHDDDTESLIRKSSIGSSRSQSITELPSSKYSIQNPSDEETSSLLIKSKDSKLKYSKSQVDPKSGNSTKKLIKDNTKSKPQVSKSKVNLNMVEKRQNKLLKKPNDHFPHTQDKINMSINKNSIPPAGNKLNIEKNSSKLVKTTQIDNVNGSE